ncbi:MAG: hypothetical protein ABI036_07600 [Fibrobacteria bacterium]
MKNAGMKWLTAAFLVFLGVDLVMFGNCVIPPDDASAVPVKPGVVQVGVQGLAALAIPFSPSVHVRTGLNGVTDLGLHADYEILESGEFGSEVEVGGSRRFQGADYLALGFDVKRAFLKSDGTRLFALQAGLTGHSPAGTGDSPAAYSGMAGILLGDETFYGGARVHIGMQRVPFQQYELPLGCRFLFFRERLGLELGAAPGILIAEGYESIPWPYQYMGLQWNFGRKPVGDK